MWFKKALSYFFDVSLEKTASPYNPVLEVSLSLGRYRLDTKNATYSYEERYETYSNAFKTLNLPPQSLKNVLILGAGLGSIVYMLDKKFQQHPQYQMVEIDAKVIELAKKYLPQKYQEQITFHCNDAFAFIQEKQQFQPFDLIAFDVFIDDETAAKFREIAFLNQLKSYLKPNTGWLLYNTLKNKRTDQFWSDFQQVFPNAQMISTTGNDMLVNRR